MIVGSSDCEVWSTEQGAGTNEDKSELSISLKTKNEKRKKRNMKQSVKQSVLNR